VKLRVLSPALEEVAEAALWYDSQRVGLGEEFWQAVDVVLQRIEENPAGFGKSEYATNELDIRFAIVLRFGYAIHYLIEAEEVHDVSIAHVARRPGYWLLRIHK
jgi:hypothetical protein